MSMIPPTMAKAVSRATQDALKTINSKSPDLSYGIMKFYNDNTGTGRA